MKFNREYIVAVEDIKIKVGLINEDEGPSYYVKGLLTVHTTVGKFTIKKTRPIMGEEPTSEESTNISNLVFNEYKQALYKPEEF